MVTDPRDYLFPPKCVGCNNVLPVPCNTPREKVLCTQCAEKWQKAVEEFCPRCHSTASLCSCMPSAMQGVFVGFSKIFIYWPGMGYLPTSRLLYTIKQHMTHRHADYCAHLLAPIIKQVCEQNGWDISETCITFVPRRRRAVRKYGYDQSQWIAKSLAKLCHMSCVKMIERKRSVLWEQEQKKRTLKERITLAGGEYAPVHLKADDPAKNCRHIFLLDDVVTTGASMSSCAKILLDHPDRLNKNTNIYALALGMTAEDR